MNIVTRKDYAVSIVNNVATSDKTLPNKQIKG